MIDISSLTINEIIGILLGLFVLIIILIRLFSSSTRSRKTRTRKEIDNMKFDGYVHPGVFDVIPSKTKRRSNDKKDKYEKSVDRVRRIIK